MLFTLGSWWTEKWLVQNSDNLGKNVYTYSETAKTPQVSVEDYETQHMDPIKATFCRVLRAFPVPQTLWNIHSDP